MFHTLLELLHSALWGAPVSGTALSPAAFAKLVRLARRQCVEGWVLQALMDNYVHLEKRDAVACYVAHGDLIEQNRQVNDILRRLCRLLDSRQLRYCIVKGQTFIPLYRSGMSRVAGDIDLYCPPESYDEARALMAQTWQVEWESDADEAEQHEACTYEDIHIELHFCLKKFYSRRSQRCFDRLVNTATYPRRRVDDVDVPVLPPTLEIAYTFLHLYHHLVNKGVALRQFCDLAMLLSRLDYDRSQLIDILRRLDHLKAFRAVAAVLTEVLGLPADRLPCEVSDADRRHINPLMRIVFRHGNFGMYGNRHASRSGWAYYRETFAQKMSYMRQFYRLAPRESRNVLVRSLPQKMWAGIRRQCRTR